MTTVDELLGLEQADFISIDSSLRSILIPDSIKNLGVEYDDAVLRLNFNIPRFYGEFDLSEFVIRINYLNAKAEPDIYEVGDVQIDETSLTFSWLVGRHATAYKGKVNFNLCLKKIENDIVVKEFNTMAADLPVLEGLETGAAVIQEHADILEQWKDQLFNKFEDIETNLEDVNKTPDTYKFEDITEEVGVETGYYYGGFTHNTLKAWTCVAAPIPCEAGDVFRFTSAVTNTDGRQQAIKCYNADQTLVGEYHDPDPEIGVTRYCDKIFIVPENIAYIAVNCWNGNGEYTLKIEKATPVTDVNFLTTLQLADYIPAYSLVGKTLYSDGDSIALGAGSGYISYAHLLSSKYNMPLTSRASGGTTLAVRADRADSIYERIISMSGTYDYIILNGGINDIINNIPLGTVTDDINIEFDTTTTLGALEAICKHLNTNYFRSKKLFVFIHSHVPRLSAMKNTFTEMKKVLEKWGLPYVDISQQFNLGHWNSSVAIEYFKTNDQLHPNLKSYREIYLPCIEKALLYKGI